MESIKQPIVLAVDGSEHSDRAAAFAGQLSAWSGEVVDIVHVVHEPDVIPAAVMREYSNLEHVYVSQRDMLENVGSQIVTNAARIVRSNGGTVGHEAVEIGNTAQEITAYADRVNAHSIVMGRRGLGDIEGLLLGSVSHRVGHLSHRTLITTE
ncbi:MAG: universal stress protein [Acidimicrobiia bacterium]|nr:universal stress protein [Acidimicrobiia bacterium]